MDRQDFLDDLQRRIGDLLKSSPAVDFERNVRALFQQAFQKLELVTREEFDLQRELLQRAREQVTALETRIAALEAHAQGRSPVTQVAPVGGAPAAGAPGHASPPPSGPAYPPTDPT